MLVANSIKRSDDMSANEILFSWDLIRAMNSVWEAHQCAAPMFNEDDYTDYEIAAIATNRQALLKHGNQRVVNELNETIKCMGEKAVIERVVKCRVVG